MKFDVIGLHPDNALKIALDIFDSQADKDAKVRALLNNKPIKKLNSVDLPKNFISGKTIDLNASELLGVGSVASYFNWSSSQSGIKNTFQAIVGIEDASKPQGENYLSDGAVWHNQKQIKMLAQQVMVQGYFPERQIRNADIIEAIEKKTIVRSNYPDNCMLIVNVFAEDTSIDRIILNQELSKIENKFTDTYVVVYNMPVLTFANVSYIDELNARGLTIQLKRHQHEDVWRFNKQ